MIRWGATTAAAAMILLLIAAPATLGAKSRKLRDGYYAANTRVKSADVEFHVRSHGTRTRDLVLVCPPKDTSLLGTSIDAQIAVKAPVLKIRNGRISYHGAAAVAPASAGEQRTGSSSLRVSLHRVSGPTIHFVNTLGVRMSETAAWKGTALSPACSTVANGGKVTLFGPIAGE